MELGRVMQPLYDAGIRVYVCRGNHEIADMWYALPDELPDPADNCARRWLKVFGNDEHPQYEAARQRARRREIHVVFRRPQECV